MENGINATIMSIEQLAKLGIEQEKEINTILQLAAQREKNLKESIEKVTGKSCTITGEPGKRIFHIGNQNFSSESVFSVIQNWKNERVTLVNSLNASFNLNNQKVGSANFIQDKDIIEIKNTGGEVLFKLDPKQKRVSGHYLTNTTEILVKKIREILR